MIQVGTGKRYTVEQKRSEIEAWGGLASARLSDYAGALNSMPEEVLGAVERKGIVPFRLSALESMSML